MITWKQYSSQKLIEPHLITQKVNELKKEGFTIATLNGSFDLLHAGHMYMLYEASLTADILIVALNSDSSIKQYKDPKRPIICLEHRMEMMSALSFVDYVTWFDELDPRAILDAIKPDVHVNGEEYGPNCIEAEIVKKNGGILKLIPRLPGLATSEILEKIKKICV